MKPQLLAAQDSLLGKVLLGRYRVVRELAKGGMGVVYLARAEGAASFVKPVVVKLLLPEHTEDDRMVRMFVREARILSQLRHPSIVDVLEFGEQDGGYVLVLEYVRGYHLGLWLRYLSLKQRTPSIDMLLQLVIDVLEALHHAHTQLHPDGSSMQIVHRDVSPSNVILDENGRARLLDFGVARMRGGAQDYKTQVQGGFMGKLPYTAPEVFAGSEASPSSDLYACAIVLHEAIYGQNVFRAETQAATLQRVLSHVPAQLEPLNAEVPKGLDAVLGRALAKSPAERHHDARELAVDLRRLQQSPESEIRARLADLLKEDFGMEMAKLLNIESLADRDAAWRRLSVSPTADTSTALIAANTNAARTKPTPAPIGATVASRSGKGSVRLNVRNREQPDVPENTGTPTLRERGAPPKAHEDDASERITRPAPAPQPKAAPGAKPKAKAAKGLLAQRPQLLAAAVALLAAAAGAVWMLDTRTGQTSATLEPDTTPIQFHPVAPKPPASATAVTAPATAGNAALQPTAANTGERDPSLTPKPKPKPTAPSASALTRALRRQQPKLEACFKTHSRSLEGQAKTELIFDLAQDGKLTHVELSPRMLADTSLGQCLLKVARSTEFPPQPRAVSFIIPLTASTSRTGDSSARPN